MKGYSYKMHSSARHRGSNRQDISKEKDDKQWRPSCPANTSLNAISNMCQSDQEETLLEELWKLRKENRHLTSRPFCEGTIKSSLNAKIF